MANQNDSFIDEVTDELRRDKLFGFFRRYGWIAILIILGIVGGAIWREWSFSRERQEAQAWGDAILAAQTSGDPAALTKVDPDGSNGRKALGTLLAAGQWVESGGTDAAVEALRTLAGDSESDGVLKELAQLKLVMLTGASMDAAEKDEILTYLSRAGAPFELLALEQKAVALLEAGREEDAVTLIRQIQKKEGQSADLRQRLSDMMIVLTGEPEPATVPGE